MEKYLHLLSGGDKIGLTLIRLSIAIVFMWIGLLKLSLTRQTALHHSSQTVH